ncbi:MAG: hypothetical protein MHM6MM_008806 [Cercozoa sp. M6MM]
MHRCALRGLNSRRPIVVSARWLSAPSPKAGVSPNGEVWLLPVEKPAQVAVKRSEYQEAKLMLKRASKQKPEADKIDEVNRETEEKKQDELDPAELRRTKWQLDESQLEEVFTRGWGHGGQCVNRTRNAVILQHLPSGEIVRCHETRSLQRNREIARKRMIER